jgi:hypothetical protein
VPGLLLSVGYEGLQHGLPKDSWLDAAHVSIAQLRMLECKMMCLYMLDAVLLYSIFAWSTEHNRT